MNRRTWLHAPLAALAAAFSLVAAQAQEAPKSIRIGWAAAKSGPNASMTDASMRPNYDLWVKEVNAAGGVMLKAYGKRVPIELVEYDDRSSTEETVRAVERLVTQDKVDFLLPPVTTGANIAAAPLFAKHGYAQLGTTVQTERAPELI